MDDRNPVLIHVYAGDADGTPIHEELPALQSDDGTYLLLSSPGLALNMAKGDLIAIPDPDRPAEVLSRGGNFCVQVYCDSPEAIDIKKLEREVNEELAGNLDGVNGANLAFSISARTGMERIRKVFDAFTAETGVPWYYANIYKNFEDPEDETLLGWWV